MSLIDLSAIRAELATALEAVSGLRVYPYPVDQIAPPAAVVAFPERVSYDFTYGRGADVLEMNVWVLVSRDSMRAGTEAIDNYLSGSMVKAALEADPTLGGNVDSLKVSEATVGVIPVGGTDYLAATFTIEIVT